jgi:hypothetical protein
MKTVEIRLSDEEFDRYQAAAAAWYEGTTDGYGKPLGLERFVKSCLSSHVSRVEEIVERSKRGISRPPDSLSVVQSHPAASCVVVFDFPSSRLVSVGMKIEDLVCELREAFISRRILDLVRWTDGVRKRYLGEVATIKRRVRVEVPLFAEERDFLQSVAKREGMGIEEILLCVAVKICFDRKYEIKGMAPCNVLAGPWG